MRKWAPSSSCEQDQFGKGKSRLHLMGWVFEKEERMQDSVRWSFDVLLIDKWIDRECQIGFCPLQEKRERERIMERRCHAAALLHTEPLLITDMCQANLPHYITPLRFLSEMLTRIILYISCWGSHQAFFASYPLSFHKWCQSKNLW